MIVEDPEREVAGVEIDPSRLWRRIEALAEIGANAEGRVLRPAFSAVENEARVLLANWSAARNFAVALDPIGNLFIRRGGREPGPVVLTGSHIDTPTLGGGRFDGALGVLAGLETLEALEDA